jgi:5'-phosphate synthase pdxT subunit
MGYQGGSDLHIAALNMLNIPCKKIYQPEDIATISALIMPGGESSVQYKYCQQFNLIDQISNFAASNKPIFGTCAGAILLSKYISNQVTGFGLLDIDVKRNSYGRQIASGIKKSDRNNEVLFIRAPSIIILSENVEILDSYQQQPILIKQGNIYAATFHPEALNINNNNILANIFANIN